MAATVLVTEVFRASAYPSESLGFATVSHNFDFPFFRVRTVQSVSAPLYRREGGLDRCGGAKSGDSMFTKHWKRAMVLHNF